jgi:hypothetical protein
MHYVVEKLLKERLKPTFKTFIFTLPELTFRVLLLAPHQTYK